MDIQKFKDCTKVYCIQGFLARHGSYVVVFKENNTYYCDFKDNSLKIYDEFKTSVIFENSVILSNFITMQEYRCLKINDLLNA